MTIRAFEILLTLIETLVLQLKAKEILNGEDILALVAAARKEAGRRQGG